MTLRLCSILMLLIALGSSPDCWTQVINEDSLRQSILKSIPGPVNLERLLPKSFLDTSKMSSLSPVDLKKIFQEVNKEIVAARSAGDINNLSKGYGKLSSLDSIRGNYKGAYENYKLYASYQDSLQKKEFEKKELQAKMQRDFDNKQAQQRLEKEREHRKNLIRQIILFAFLLGFIVVATTFFVAYKREQRGKKLLNVQNKEIESTLSELRSTQAQLIHSEKMASLGELTTGIAHEIQNPLNFVNNFSEVNTELVDELTNELAIGNVQSAKEIAGSIRDNEQKINHHGKRADAIVKGMLQHSRTSTGQTEPTDINALCDEYVRVSYHGLRAKDQSFNAKLETDFDNTVGKINVIPQDIGRVILNLINNAFYAAPLPPEGGFKDPNHKHEPTVWLSTKKVGDKVLISVRDNGPGISQKNLDKIFQPFFTTKPTGQGTGLGLSLAYDIVKAHGGEIKVETKEGEGSEFVVRLSII